MKQLSNFTEGRILPPLLKFSIPVLCALILQSAYGAVDLLVVGQFGTAADVSAVSTGSQVMQAITSIMIGLAMGTTILLGQRIGQKKYEEAGETIGSGICLFAVIAVLVTVLMMVFAAPMSAFMNAPAEAFDKTVQYVRICSAGSVFIIAYNLLGSIFRGIGDSKTPLLTVAIACGINILGDLLFVGVFHMNAAGAALATVISQASSVIASVFIIRKKGLPFTFTRKCLRFNMRYIGLMLKLGSPIALQDGLVSMSFLVILMITNKLGLIVSAGVGVAGKLVSFMMLVPSAFMQSMSAFVAQNEGANLHSRSKRAMLCGMGASLCIGVIMAYVSFLHGNILAGFFAKETEVIHIAAEYIRAFSIDCILTCFLFSFIGYFNGCGMTRFVMLQGIVGAFGVRVPVSYFMSRLIPVSVFKIGLATPCSSMVQIILCIFCFAISERVRKRTARC